jgi:hypothetical protein
VFSEQNKIWEAWAARKLNQTEYETVWKTIPFSEKQREKIEQTIEISTGMSIKDMQRKNQLTAWNTFNVLTQYTTHEIQSIARQTELMPAISKTIGNFQ